MRLFPNNGFGSPVAGWVAVGMLAAGIGMLAGCRSSDGPVRPGSRTVQQTGVSSVPSSAWQAEADRWIGTPYHRGGDSRAGADCSGFVQQVYLRVARVSLPRVTQDQFRVGFEVGRSELRPGDLVFFETLGKGVSHVGLMVGGDRFAHASSSKGVIYSRLSETYWNRQFLGARRIPRRSRAAGTTRRRQRHAVREGTFSRCRGHENRRFWIPSMFACLEGNSRSTPFKAPEGWRTPRLVGQIL